MTRINIPKTTDLRELIRKVYANSAPIGMGFLHYRPGCLTDREIDTILTNSQRHSGNIINMDYVNGRQCKFRVTIDETTGEWSTSAHWDDHSTAQLQQVLEGIYADTPQQTAVDEFLQSPPDSVPVPMAELYTTEEDDCEVTGDDVDSMTYDEVAMSQVDGSHNINPLWLKHVELYGLVLASKPSLAAALKQHYDPEVLVGSPDAHIQTKYDKLVKLARKNGVEV